MTRVTRTFHIVAEPEAVFSYLVDPTVMSRVSGTTMEVVHETPEGVGNVWAWTDRMLGMRVMGVGVFTEYVPNERVRWRLFGVVDADTTWTVEPEPGGCKLVFDSDLKVRVPLLGRLLRPLMMREMEKNVRTMKAELEAARPRVGTAA